MQLFLTHSALLEFVVTAMDFVEAQMNLSSLQISCLCLVGILELLNNSAKGPGGKDDGVWMWHYQR